MQRKIVSFEDLKCWKACRKVRQHTMEIIKQFPTEEKYALTDGMRRSARSTTENIAKGFGRYHYKENIQYSRISRGSLFELANQHIAAYDDKYITKEEYTKGRKLIDDALPFLNGYIRYLQNAKAGNNSKLGKTMKEKQSIYITQLDTDTDI